MFWYYINKEYKKMMNKKKYWTFFQHTLSCYKNCSNVSWIVELSNLAKKQALIKIKIILISYLSITSNTFLKYNARVSKTIDDFRETDGDISGNSSKTFPNFFKGRNFVFFLHPPISFPGTLDRFTSNPSICFKTLLTAMEIPRIYHLLGLAVTSLLSFTSSVEQTAFGECYVTM